jgi:REP element-mobilizing transposase RayT
MARPLRLEHAGALWHVTSRGNERQSIFRDDRDRDVFLRLLGGAVRRFRWRLHAYVLMGNHYHLLLETPEPNLSAGMHRLNGVYSQRFNRQHDRVGHLLQGRFKAILVEKERHLLELVRYVVLNPVRAGLVRTAFDWPWSNFRATAGLMPPPAWLETQWTISQFGSGREARQSYQEFVLGGGGGVDRPWRRIAGQLFLGSDDFRRRMRELLDAERVSPEVPLAQRRAVRPDLADVVRASAKVVGADPSEVVERRRTPLRLLVAYVGRRDSMAKLADLGSTLGVSITSAHEICASARRLRLQEPQFRSLLRRVRAEIRKIET